MIFNEFGLIYKKAELAPEIFDFWIKLPQIAESACPGQFLHVLCGEKTLRRPISICDCDAGRGLVRMVFESRGEGTKWLSERKEGEQIDVLGPIGKGFCLGQNDLQNAGLSQTFKNPVFIGGGIGVPPLLFTARQLAARQPAARQPAARQLAAKKSENLTVILGFRSAERVILPHEFEALGNVIVTTEDGSAGIKGFVTLPLEDLIKSGTADILYACGPTPMLKGIQALAERYDIPCQLSLEQRMACGVGACLGCACKTHKNGKEAYSHVCKDGPVFWAKEVCFDE